MGNLRILNKHYLKAIKLIEFLSHPDNDFTKDEQEHLFLTWKNKTNDDALLKEAETTIGLTTNRIYGKSDKDYGKSERDISARNETDETDYANASGNVKETDGEAVSTSKMINDNGHEINDNEYENEPDNDLIGTLVKEEESERSDVEKGTELESDEEQQDDGNSKVFDKTFEDATEADAYVEGAICNMKLYHENHEIDDEVTSLSRRTIITCTTCEMPMIERYGPVVTNRPCECKAAYRYPVNGEWSEVEY